jgi:hypothetical protein
VRQAAAAQQPKRLAYADPPYPGLAARYYRNEASYAGEVDHAQLIQRLRTFDGWALSTSRKGLRQVLALAPVGVYVCPWVKIKSKPKSLGPANIHEYVLVQPARLALGGPPDAFCGQVARGGDSDLKGRKPIKFVRWIFQLLGAMPGDTLADLYPGSGVVGRCWGEFTRQASPTAAGGATHRPRPPVARRSDPVATPAPQLVGAASV